MKNMKYDMNKDKGLKQVNLVTVVNRKEKVDGRNMKTHFLYTNEYYNAFKSYPIS